MADVASTLPQWSITASSNQPADATTIGGGLADNFQQIQATVRAYLAHYNAVAIVGAGTTDLGAVTGFIQEVSGAATITSFGTVSAGISKIVRFQGASVLTYNAGSLVLPGQANITTAAGDWCLAYSKGSGNWEVPIYTRLSGLPVSYLTAPFVDSTAIIKGSADPTKLVRIEADGISAGTTRVVTVPDLDLTLNAVNMGDHVKGLTASAAGGNGQLVCQASQYVFRNASGITKVLRSTSSYTINTATAGPAVDGRDQAGAFANGAEIHAYAIYNDAAVHGLFSATGPDAFTGATLPGGYTWWTYLGTYVLAAGGVNFQALNQGGNAVFYKTPPEFGTSLDNTNDTQIAAVTVNLYVPSNALSFLVFCRGSSGWSGSGWATFSFGAISGSYSGGVGYFGTSGAQGGSQAAAELPYVAAGLWYKRATQTGTQTAPVASLWCTGYRIANGDS